MDQALRQAIEQGDPRAVESALDRGANIELADVHGCPGLPLRIACFTGNIDVVHILIERGADIHAPNDRGPGGPIRTARRAEHGAIVDLLVTHGATDPDGHPASAQFASERRKRDERRRQSGSPPGNLRERRSHEERRATLVEELALPEQLWERYFSQSVPAGNFRADIDEQQAAGDILARARD